MTSFLWAELLLFYFTFEVPLIVIQLGRKKGNSEEEKRLHHIQEELQKLDLQLRNDVETLRNKIEKISIDYVEAQKRYSKAEMEFLEAKQNLLGKLKKKEFLAKLLCTTIEQNEMRKSQKLSELIEKLRINKYELEANHKICFSKSFEIQLPPSKAAAECKENGKLT